MSQRRQNRRLATLRDRLDRAATAQPNVDDHLNEQRNIITIIRSSTTDATHSSRGDHSDPTARALLQLDKINNTDTEIRDFIAAMELAMNHIEEAQRTALGYRVSRDPKDTTDNTKPRCIGDNTAAGATCWQIPTERRDHNTNQTINDGRCIDCGHRVDTRKANKAEHERKRRLAGDAA